MTQLSPNFALAELTYSATAERDGLDNTPTPEALANLTHLAVTVLQPVRDLVGVPVHVHDGYRGPAVNAAVGGVADSQHCQGLAADIDAAPEFSASRLFDTIRVSQVPFDQVILEPPDTVHVSASAPGTPPRRQAWIRHGARGAWTYTEVTND